MPKLMTSLKIPSTFYLWKGGKCPLCLVGWLYPVCTGLSQNLLAVGVGGWSNRTPWLECVRRSKMKIQGEKGHVESRTRPKIFQGRPDLRSTQKDPPGPGARIQSKAKSTKKNPSRCSNIKASSCRADAKKYRYSGEGQLRMSGKRRNIDHPLRSMPRLRHR